jgi:2'-5' RNA ligase
VPHLRLGVVLLVPAPLATAIDGLRRAFGDPMLDRVAPHVTLVPPVNVRGDRVAEALRVMRTAAATTVPLNLTLGPVTTFPGDEHVGYLEVTGDDAASYGLRRLRDEVFRPPLERTLDHGFVPHVTVTTGGGEEHLAAVVAASGGWTGEPVRFERVHLLQERHGPGTHRWVPIADVALGPAIIVGRGGLELELSPSELVDPEAAASVRQWAESTDGAAEIDDPATPDGPVAAAGSDAGGPRPLVVVARREGHVVGVVRGWTDGSTAEVAMVDLDPEVRRDHVDDHLLAAWHSAAADRLAS